MSRKPRPLFLERRSYRRRRLSDAARILPLLGFVLFLVPILWLPAETPAPDTGRGGVYVFAVWFLLIIATFGLSRVLSDDEDAKRPDGDD
ncbi:hypothetical protein OEW28_16280 [Defluviimonas sp. WL0002]|uniref:DUF3311 domain-containing protein n=1 Tax=Albidovulum marisflavi TaxID=2984159 RepID=A0ABT2ZGC3_9RHOB|nr:hypothetical protein [Defluviimonas sp. WL0002]MCV2870189.1 hypothetical protein [Defluviimonas sp. WL0002]